MKRLICLFAMAMLVSGCFAKHRGLTTDEKAIAGGLQRQIYYTQANIWYSDTRPTTSKNIHIGTIIPVGTKVNIERCSGAQIKFSDSQGVVYTLVLSRKSLINLMDYFNRYFSKENPMADGGSFSKFTKQEQENIKKGIIDFNMSKEAVLMAYGYPPPSWTPNIQKDQWEYIEGGSTRIKVYFGDKKVVKIDDIQLGRMRPGRRAQRITVRENKSQTDTSAQKDSNADEILKYKKLMDNGVITQAEFEQKKKQLLGL